MHRPTLFWLWNHKVKYKIGRLNRKWKINIKTNLRKAGYENMYWTERASSLIGPFPSTFLP
jgi:hypothetical protein